MGSSCAPQGAQAVLDGIYYKIGLRDLVFYWVGDSWLNSSFSEIPKGAVSLTAAPVVQRYRTGSSCADCRSTLRYVSSGHCVFCVSAAGREAQSIVNDDVRAALSAEWLRDRDLLRLETPNPAGGTQAQPLKSQLGSMVYVGGVCHRCKGRVRYAKASGCVICSNSCQKKKRNEELRRLRPAIYERRGYNTLFDGVELSVREPVT